MVSRIAIVLAALMIVGGVAHGATYSRVADKDGYIGQAWGSADSWLNNWSEADMRLGWGYSSYPQVRRPLMRFDVNWAEVPTSITAATLNIDVWTVNATSADVKLALITEAFDGTYPETDWFYKTGGTVMWTTPGGSPETSSELDVTLLDNTSMDIDVLSLINIWKANQSGYSGLMNYDATQSTTDNSYSRIHSTESDIDLHRHPTLVIVPEPASLTLLVLGGVGVLLRRRR